MVSDLKDRAITYAMLYNFGWVGGIAVDVEDYRISNHQRMFLLHEKGVNNDIYNGRWATVILAAEVRTFILV